MPITYNYHPFDSLQIPIPTMLPTAMPGPTSFCQNFTWKAWKDPSSLGLEPAKNSRPFLNGQGPSLGGTNPKSFTSKMGVEINKPPSIHLKLLGF